MYLCFSMVVSATIILTLGLGHRDDQTRAQRQDSD